ncbi:MAG: glycoside hydrolase family 88 protein [Oscillospiraceae bacterium]|jgi:unsaturated chondroitin disaccharide hydrolase|nr:glycoside hydrolase family 88 protein [Oscillospiraceae bacterium]
MNDNDIRQWADAVWTKIKNKMPESVMNARKLDTIPYTTDGGDWINPYGTTWWTNGFYPAVMWQMYLGTDDPLYREEANRAEDVMDEIFRQFETTHHDLGFQYKISSVVNYQLTGGEKSLRRALLASNLLAGRFNPNGFLVAWNEERPGWSIIDSMMNLTMLYWASRETHDPRFALIAKAHAERTVATFFREDDSSHHIVIFDPETGGKLDTPRGQGYAAGSTWTRGNAWAVYGFTLSYLWTGNEAYLAQAERTADNFLRRLGADNLPNIDFDQPGEPYAKDDCAAAIVSCGLIEMSRVIADKEKAERYLSKAVEILKALDEHHADWSQKPGILTHCTGEYGNPSSWHIKMIYGDFFFIEAIQKLCGTAKNLWLL